MSHSSSSSHHHARKRPNPPPITPSIPPPAAAAATTTTTTTTGTANLYHRKSVATTKSKEWQRENVIEDDSEISFKSTSKQYPILTSDLLEKQQQQQQHQRYLMLQQASSFSSHHLPAKNNALGGNQLFRTPNFVDDKHYGRYMRNRARGRSGNNTCNPRCCSQGCAGFSFVAVCFLLFIGFLVDTQPLYIPGTLPKITSAESGSSRSKTMYYIGSTTERLPVARHAYQTALAYFVTFMIVILYAYKDWLQSMFRRRLYQDLPEATATYAMSAISDTDSVLPVFHTSEFLRQQQQQQQQQSLQQSYQTQTEAYPQSNWNNFMAAVATTSTMKIRGWMSQNFIKSNNPKGSARRKGRGKTSKTV